MIDVTQPLELDDGTPVEFVSVDKRHICVRTTKYDRGAGPFSPTTIYYRKDTGIFAGGDSLKQYVLRNSEIESGPEDWQL